MHSPVTTWLFILIGIWGLRRKPVEIKFLLADENLFPRSNFMSGVPWKPFDYLPGDEHGGGRSKVGAGQ